MTGGSVSFNLDDGETLLVPDEDLRRVYETLWELSKEPGAVSTAALLIGSWRTREFMRTQIEFTTLQSAVLRKAVALLPDDTP
jgi:hypothetical protein